LKLVQHHHTSLACTAVSNYSLVFFTQRITTRFRHVVLRKRECERTWNHVWQ